MEASPFKAFKLSSNFFTSHSCQECEKPGGRAGCGARNGALICCKEYHCWFKEPDSQGHDEGSEIASYQGPVWKLTFYYIEETHLVWEYTDNVNNHLLIPTCLSHYLCSWRLSIRSVCLIGRLSTAGQPSNQGKAWGVPPPQGGESCKRPSNCIREDFTLILVNILIVLHHVRSIIEWLACLDAQTSEAIQW